MRTVHRFVCKVVQKAFTRVREQLDHREETKAKRNKNKKKEKDSVTSRTMVSIPYVKGVSEALMRVLRRHDVSVAMKPHLTLKRLLVHPKDKRAPQETAGVVYQVPCGDCPKVYTGETGRRYGVREKEHKKDVDSLRELKFTRARRKESETEFHQSALTDHVAQSNHTIAWDKVKLPVKEADWKLRGIREAISIRKAGTHSLNRDEGRYQLPPCYSRLLTAALPGAGREH